MENFVRFLSRSATLAAGICIAAIVTPASASARSVSFKLPAQAASSGIRTFASQAGVQILVDQQLTRNKRTSAVRGSQEVLSALRQLLAGTGLDILSVEGDVITLGRKRPERSGEAKDRADATILVQANRTPSRMERKATAVVDSVRFDDIATFAGGDGSVVEQLVTLPGISAIEEGDTPRFISIRGIGSDLNSTTVDGISIASIGSDGDGSRKVNLQLVPSNMSAGNEVYKSFSPETPGDAIGGWVNIATRSAFDHNGFYKVIDLAGIYSTQKGAAHINDVTGSGSHWGESAKGVVSTRFGEAGQFGIVLTGEYQKRIRNGAKYWQGTKYYFSDAGKKQSGPDSEDWNGLIVPYDQQYASYTNTLRTYGGSAKLEWHSTDNRFYASILGFGRRRYEDSTMNKQDYYTKSAIYDQTEDGGTQQINSIYLRYRHDNWNRRLFGTIGDFSFAEGKNLLQIRGGYTKALYDNHQNYVVARTYPTSAYLTYSSDNAMDGLPYMTGLSDTAILDPSQQTYKSSTAYALDRIAREAMGNARIDYAYNAQDSDRGVGVAIGAEWRNLILRRDLNKTNYATGADMTDYLITPGYTAIGQYTAMPWVSYTYVDQFANLAVDEEDSAYDSLISDYRYNETTITPYAAIHYRTDRLAMVWGVRLDHTRFTADTPAVESGTITGFTRSNGGYDFVLPSLSVEYQLGHRLSVSASASRTIGRPTPGDVAQAESTSCGETDEGGEGCSISRGNADLQPRRATNLDLTITQGFNGDKGLVGISGFAKWIADDIYDLTTTTTIDDTVYTISQPLNASGSRVFGVEGRIENKGMRLLGQKFDAFANLTWMKGRMEVAGDDGTRIIERMLYQPKVLANVGLTWHTPFLRSALTARYNYRSKYLESVGSSPWLDEGRASYGTVDLSLRQRIAPFATLKYDVYNVTGEKPRWLIGDKLQYVSEVDNYGRSIFVHLIIR